MKLSKNKTWTPKHARPSRTRYEGGLDNILITKEERRYKHQLLRGLGVTPEQAHRMRVQAQPGELSKVRRWFNA